MKQHKLSTRTFGKTAKIEVAAILGGYGYKKVNEKLYKLVDQNNKMVGWVNLPAWNEEVATLTAM